MRCNPSSCSPAPRDTLLPEEGETTPGWSHQCAKVIMEGIVGNTGFLLQPRLFSNSPYLRNKLHISCCCLTAGQVQALLDTPKDTHLTQTSMGALARVGSGTSLLLPSWGKRGCPALAARWPGAGSLPDGLREPVPWVRSSAPCCLGSSHPVQCEHQDQNVAQAHH